MEPPVFSESVPKPKRDPAVRDRVYRAVSNQVREILAETPLVRVNKDVGQRIFEAVVEILFVALLQESYLRFPGGFGSFRVARLKRLTAPKALPNGAGTMQLQPHRMKLRYEAGATVREALGMPPQTSHVRKFDRRSKLSDKTRALLTGEDSDDAAV